MSFDPIWSVLVIETDYKYVVVGRESGLIEKYKLSDLKGKPILSLKNAHTQSVTTLVQTPQGGDEIYSGSLDRSICQWNLTDDTETLAAEAGGKRLIKTTLTTTGIRCGVVVNEMFCCGGSDGGVHALREGTPERWMGHSDAVSCVAQSQTENGDGLLASGSYDGTIRIWNTASGSCIYILGGHTSHVKCVQFLNGPMSVMGCGRDDTARLWLLPEEIDLEGAGRTGAADDDEDDGGSDEGGPEGDGSIHRLGGHRGTKEGGIRRLDCAAILGLPASPMCGASQSESENPLIAVGFSGGPLATFKANKFYSSVASFTKNNATEVKRERKRLDALLKAEEKKELTLRKKATRKKKKELIEEQKKEETEAKNKEKSQRAAERAAERASIRDEYGDEEDEEMPEENDEGAEDEEDFGDEEGEEFTLDEARLATLESFKEKQKKESDDRLRTLRSAVGDRKRLLEPIGVKKFEREPKQFGDLSFTRFVARAAPETINAIAFNGSNAVVAVGSSLMLLDCTPGVQSV